MSFENIKPESRTLQQAIWEVSPFIMRQIRHQAVRTILNEYEITRSQFHVLMQISHGHNTISSLANHDGISLPAISRQVDELERKKIISRTRDPQDRRTVHLTITEEGLKIKETLRMRVLAWLNERVDILSPHEQQIVHQGLELLAKVFTDTNTESSGCGESE